MNRTASDAGAGQEGAPGCPTEPAPPAISTLPSFKRTPAPPTRPTGMGAISIQPLVTGSYTSARFEKGFVEPSSGSSTGTVPPATSTSPPGSPTTVRAQSASGGVSGRKFIGGVSVHSPVAPSNRAARSPETSSASPPGRATPGGHGAAAASDPGVSNG